MRQNAAALPKTAWRASRWGHLQPAPPGGPDSPSVPIRLGSDHQAGVGRQRRRPCASRASSGSRSTQGGMIAGFFTYEQFPLGRRARAARRDRLRDHHHPDAEDLDQRLPASGVRHAALSYAGGLAGWDRPRSIASGGYPRWCAGSIQRHADPRRTKANVPTKPQQLHLNLWGARPAVPMAGRGGPNPGDLAGRRSPIRRC